MITILLIIILNLNKIVYKAIVTFKRYIFFLFLYILKIFYLKLP